MIEMTPVEFWQWALPKIKAEYPEMIFIGEIYQPHIYRTFIKDGCFDYLYDKVGLYDMLKAVMSGQTSASNITYALQQTADIRGNMLTFLENHDEQRIASDFFATKAERALAALIVSVAIGKQPFMLYAGQELGERGMDKEGYSGVDGRTTIFDYWSVDTLRRWKGDGNYDTTLLTAEEKELQAFYAKLLKLCNSSEALQQGEFYDLQYANPWSDTYDSNHIYSFLRGSENELLLIVTNFSDTARDCRVTIPEEAYAYFGLSSSSNTVKATELLTGEKMSIVLNSAEKISVNVPANSGVIIKMNK